MNNETDAWKRYTKEVKKIVSNKIRLFKKNNSIVNNRPLSKLAFGREFEGESELKNRSVQEVHEDLGLEPTYKLPAKVEFRKKSNQVMAKNLPYYLDLHGSTEEQ
mgnify:CR=1 FL=1